jgi:hypothetical protein
MKYLKILGLAAVAATAFMGIFESASATGDVEMGRDLHGQKPDWPQRRGKLDRGSIERRSAYGRLRAP